MAACGIAFFQRGLDDAAQFVELIDELESSSSFTHAVLTEAYTEAMTAVAAAAAATQRVELVTGIVNIYWRHPYALAMAAANVAAVSGGRFLLGLGTGHQPVNVDGLGYDMSRPLARMRDYVMVLRALLSGNLEPDSFVNVETEHYRAQNVRIGWPAARVPLLLGALGEGMLRLAGELADGAILSLAPLERIPAIRTVVESGAETAGRSPADVSIMAFVNTVLRPSRDAARPLLRQTLEGYLKLPYYRQALAPDGYDAARGLSDEQVDQLGIAGPPEYAVQCIERYRQAGVDVPILAPAGVFSLPPYDADSRATYRALADVANASTAGP
jgi:alkanesulfonate monooxygenase SsuD/methylene tetrahydromethanopterin reductase-like flavin-dependent oxidoreductase (luciferase family)